MVDFIYNFSKRIIYIQAADAIKSIYSKFETETLTDFMTAFDEENIPAMKV